MAEQWGGNSLSVATGQTAQRVFAAAFARGGCGVYKEQLAGDVQLGGSAQCSLFCLTFDEFHQFYRTCQMPGVCRTPEGCTNDKAKQGLPLLSSLLSFFASQLCRMGTPICNMEKGRKIDPGHPWAAERGGGWPVQRAGNAVEPWKQMPAVIPILLVEKPIWEENKRWMRPQKEDKLEEAVASFISCFFPGPPGFHNLCWIWNYICNQPWSRAGAPVGTCWGNTIEKRSAMEAQHCWKAGIQDHAKHPVFTLLSVAFQFKGLKRRAVISPTSRCLVMQWGPGIAAMLGLESLGCRCVEIGFGTGE